MNDASEVRCVGLYVITKGMVSVSSCHCVPERVGPGSFRGPLYLGFEEVSVVTTVS